MKLLQPFVLILVLIAYIFATHHQIRNKDTTLQNVGIGGVVAYLELPPRFIHIPASGQCPQYTQEMDSMFQLRGQQAAPGCYDPRFTKALPDRLAPGEKVVISETLD